MAIGTDDGVLKFGTQDEVTVASPAAVDGNNGYSAASDVNEWTNDDDAMQCCAVVHATYAAVPDTGVLELYCSVKEVQGTNDEPDCDAAFPGHFLGSVTPDAVTSAQYLVIGPFSLPATKSGQVYKFFLRNAQGDAAHDISSGWSLWVTPSTPGPHA